MEVLIVIVATLVIIILISLLIFLVTENNKLRDKDIRLGEHLKTVDTLYNDLKVEFDLLQSSLSVTVDKLDKTVHQKKSSEVRLGKIGENLAPFTDGWPWDPNNFRFIGSPVDGIQFAKDMIYIVEIKTGGSRLSRYQAKCRDLVREGKIAFVTYRIGEDGTEIVEYPIEKDLIK